MNRKGGTLPRLPRAWHRRFRFFPWSLQFLLDALSRYDCLVSAVAVTHDRAPFLDFMMPNEAFSFVVGWAAGPARGGAACDFMPRFARDGVCLSQGLHKQGPA